MSLSKVLNSNHRPRKALEYKTPYEVFMREVFKKMVA